RAGCPVERQVERLPKPPLADRVEFLTTGHEMSNDRGIPLCPRTFSEDPLDARPRQWEPIAAQGHHGVTSVGDCDDSGDLGYGITGQTIGVTRSIESLMVAPNPRTQVGQSLHIRHDSLPHDGVLADMRKFLLCEGAGLEQHAVAEPNLPNVVEQA